MKKKKRKMSESTFNSLLTLACCVFIMVGVIWGMESMYVLIPSIIGLVLILYLYGVIKHRDTKNYPILGLSAIIIPIFILVWIGSCCSGLYDHPSENTIKNRTKIHTDKGDYMPTMDESGEYHNAGTGERQLEYGGSKEQQEDIEFADELIRNGM